MEKSAGISNEFSKTLEQISKIVPKNVLESIFFCIIGRFTNQTIHITNFIKNGALETLEEFLMKEFLIGQFYKFREESLSLWAYFLRRPSVRMSNYVFAAVFSIAVQNCTKNILKLSFCFILYKYEQFFFLTLLPLSLKYPALLKIYNLLITYLYLFKAFSISINL